MCDDREVPLSSVLEVLQYFNVSYALDPEKPGNYLLAKEGCAARSVPLPECVSKRTCQGLCRSYGTFMHLFYRPEMLKSSASIRLQ
jgi:hypothetical protein